jgi:hypothetical protein
MARSQQQQQVTRNLVEEKAYRVPYAEGSALARRALESALGLELVELAPGMWTGTKEADKHSRLEVTVRTLATDDGTSVEIQLEHRFNAKAITLFTLGITLGCVLIIPLIPTIIVSMRVNRDHERQRLVEMHRAWTEVGNAMNAPSKSSYRLEPQRAYAPVRIAAGEREGEEAHEPESEPAGARTALR